VLDLGTGGGERLAAMRDGLPRRVVATEVWAVNAPFARARLAPLGVEVVRAPSEAPLFADRSFDLVINRHSGFESDGIARLIRPGGSFVTQQVGRGNWNELAPHCSRLHDWGDHLGRYSVELRDRGFDISVREHQERVAYPSLGEFMYMLSVASWTIPDFDIEREINALLALELGCLTDEGFVVTGATC
jgi:SAM-dependent methyltransferase